MLYGDTYLLALAAVIVAALAAWLASLRLGDVSFVDSLWSLFFVLTAGVYASAGPSLQPAGMLVLLLVAVWALRLSAYITARNWGEPEDARYRQIRANNEPNFHLKSLYIVFGLQGVLAWIISTPLLYAIADGGRIGGLELAATALWVIGFVFEAGGDWQLMRFRQRRDSQGAVLDSGLWRYTRHPNYFGDACVWWSFWLFALAAGAWWTIFAPLLMTFLLLKVSVSRCWKRRSATGGRSTPTMCGAPARFSRCRRSKRPPMELTDDCSGCAGSICPGLRRSCRGPGRFRRHGHRGRRVGTGRDPAGNRPPMAVSRTCSTGPRSAGTASNWPGRAIGKLLHSEAEFNVSFLFFNAYSYRHENTERWSGDCLQQIHARTVTNGKLQKVVGEQTGDGFVIREEDETRELPRCVMTFAYWNPDFLAESRLLNPQTGEFLDVDVKALPEEELEVRGEKIPRASLPGCRPGP
ncbi:MAG: DUF6134 family protein [Woeseiaceae bacterium]|nr:DUF6134 family protein [Woeseiaceae bacterium]